MPYIKGMLGSKVIGEEKIMHGAAKKQRRIDDPIRSIKIDCKIPQNLKYNVGSMDVFNFREEIDRIQLVKYADVLQVESKFKDTLANFKY